MLPQSIVMHFRSRNDVVNPFQGFGIGALKHLPAVMNIGSYGKIRYCRDSLRF